MRGTSTDQAMVTTVEWLPVECRVLSLRRTGYIKRYCFLWHPLESSEHMFSPKQTSSASYKLMAKRTAVPAANEGYNRTFRNALSLCPSTRHL